MSRRQRDRHKAYRHWWRGAISWVVDAASFEKLEIACFPGTILKLTRKRRRQLNRRKRKLKT